MAQKDCLGASFETIAAYGANAAMMHYAPMEDTCAELEPRGFLLVDSGGQYRDGTTDITRTYALGPLTDEEREAYTLVLKCHIAAARGVQSGKRGHAYRHSGAGNTLEARPGLPLRYGPRRGICGGYPRGPAGCALPGFVDSKNEEKQKETQDILSYHTQAAGCSDKARAKASGGRQPIEECGRTGL